jgi:inward rectifier potassium channel
MREPRAEVYRGEGYEVRVIGGRRGGWRDAYHWFLGVPWWAALAVIAAAYLSLNALFALLYLLVGGIANAAPGSFPDAFFFSVQTMGTIGYGTMFPATRAANALVVAESVIGLMVIAIATGLVFARFSQTRARVAFSSRVAVTPIDGVPHLMIRVGNERRRNNIVDATFRLTVMRTTRTAEGTTIYRTVDLPLVRERAPALQRSWMVLHRMEPGSPLAGETPGSLAAADAELTLAVAGIDDTSLQPVHARHTWLAPSVVFGARLADVVSETPEGITLDLRRFHDLVPTAPTRAFPYPAGPQAGSEPGPAQAGRSGAEVAAPVRS